MIKADTQFVRSLADKRVRDRERLFVAEGAKLVEEIMASALTIRCVYTTRAELRGERVELVLRLKKLKDTTLLPYEQYAFCRKDNTC